MVKEGRIKVDQLHPSYFDRKRIFFSQAYQDVISRLNIFVEVNLNTQSDRNALFL